MRLEGIRKCLVCCLDWSNRNCCCKEEVHKAHIIVYVLLVINCSHLRRTRIVSASEWNTTQHGSALLRSVGACQAGWLDGGCKRLTCPGLLHSNVRHISWCCWSQFYWKPKVLTIIIVQASIYCWAIEKRKDFGFGGKQRARVIPYTIIRRGSHFARIRSARGEELYSILTNSIPHFPKGINSGQAGWSRWCCWKYFNFFSYV